jgi:hypothetical protein
MGLSKDKLIYDATTPSDGDSVAAFLRTGSGALTSTGGALDVNVTALTASDIDIRDLVFATDKVDVSGSEVSLDSATLAALENITVSATDLDIRDLAFATDKVDVSGSEVSLDSATLAALENITVSATDLDIRDLAFATDKVDVTGSEVSLDATTLAALENITVLATGNVADDAADSGNPIKIGTRAVSGALAAISATGDRADSISDLYRRLWVNTAPNVGGSNAAISVDTTAGGTALFASQLAGRQRVEIQNLGNKAVFVGFGTVTASNGTRIAAGATFTQMLGPDLALKAISESGTQDIRVLQLA